MIRSLIDETKFPTTSASQSPVYLQKTTQYCANRSGRNVFKFLVQREISPRTKRTSKRLWGVTSRWRAGLVSPKCEIADPRQSLFSWLEVDSLRHLLAKYCPLHPSPRSTIAAAFSSDGKTLASTHGDHTVKIINCRSGNCLKVLTGHRRTPWVVRFHPFYPEILASGSLDHEVRLWDAQTADCIGSRDFYRPIASISFHAQGELLAVACGHKLYIWRYNRRGDTSSPVIVLKTKRSLRAVHFHPHAAPYLLTAEVNDLDSPDSPLTLATTQGYVLHPPPVVFFTNINSTLRPMEVSSSVMVSPCLLVPTPIKEEERTFRREDCGASISTNNREESSPNNQTFSDTQGHQNIHTFMDLSPGEPSGSSPPTGATVPHLSMEIEPTNSGAHFKGADGLEMLAAAWFHLESSAQTSTNQYNSAQEFAQYTRSFTNIHLPVPSSSTGNAQPQQYVTSDDPARWKLPFMQGWFLGQSHASSHPTIPDHSDIHGNVSHGTGFNAGSSNSRPLQGLLASSSASSTYGLSRGSGRSASRRRTYSRVALPVFGSAEVATLNTTSDVVESQQGSVEVEFHSSLAAEATAELPCTVKLRIWHYDSEEPYAPLEPELCRLTIPHAVLCSEMGAHFSPCGRFLAACVACILPRIESDPGLNSHVQHDSTGDATSPTRHPISAHQIIYELRIYSIENSTFGLVLASRAIRAAHCLTSIQFSPTSEHILLAYGRRHNSLLRSIVVDGETAIPVYTVLEICRVSDMELVRVLPSAEDEVNVACFHPLPGGGLVYGTKEGKLRILQYDGPHGGYTDGSGLFFVENMLEGVTRWGD